MSGKWITVDTKQQKLQKAKERKERKKADEQLEEEVSSTPLGGFVVGSLARPTSAPTSIVESIRQRRAEEEKAVNEEKATRKAILGHQRKAEEAKLAKRRQAAEHAKAQRDPSLWPLTASAFKTKGSEIRQTTYRSLEGIAGSNCSYVRALYAANALESLLQNTAMIDEAIADEINAHRLPWAGIEADEFAMAACKSFAAQYFTFTVDGDASTMLNLFTSFFGAKGSREEPHGKGIGNKLSAQLLIRSNLEAALQSFGPLVNAFVHVDGNGKFHTASSYKNFLGIVHSVTHALRDEIESLVVSERSFSALSAKNAFISVIRAFSNDGCGKWDSAAAAASILQEFSEILEQIVDMDDYTRLSQPHKGAFIVLTAQDVELIARLALRPGSELSGEGARVLIMELGVEHHPDALRGFFCPLIAFLNTQHLEHGALLKPLYHALAEAATEKAADVYPSWGEAFAKNPLSSSAVLCVIAEKGSAIDGQFLEKVTQRVKKAQYQPSEADAVNKALTLVGRKCSVQAVVMAAKLKKQQDRSTVIGAREAAPEIGESTVTCEEGSVAADSAPGFVVQLAKVIVVLGGLAFLYTSNLKF